MKAKNKHKKLIGCRISKIRRELNMTQSEFAKASGIKYQHVVSQYECGYTRPKLESAAKIILLAQKYGKPYKLAYLYPELKTKGVSNG